MADDSTRSVIRWSGTTFGYNLSKDEEELFIDDSAIIIGIKGLPSRVIATYAFDPTLLPSGLQLGLINIRGLILGDFRAESANKNYLPIPEWVTSLYKIEFLVLLNADMANIAAFENLPLKYLDLRKVHIGDMALTVRTIGNLKGLEIFFHDEAFSSVELLTLKEALPNLKLVTKGTGRER